MKVQGNTQGLKKNELKRLERLYRRRCSTREVIRPDIAREMCEISRDTGRQVAVLINRRGEITHVLVGTRKQIILPDFRRFRVDPRRLRGLRYIHTHLDGSPLSREDLNDLAFLRLDFIAAITVDESGMPKTAHCAHLLPKNRNHKKWELLKPMRFERTADIDILELIRSLEEEMTRSLPKPVEAGGKQRAVLIDVRKPRDEFAEESFAELEELALASGVQLVDKIIQIKNKPDPKFVIGQGKLREITLESHQEGVDLLIFNQDLTPAQIRHIGDETDLKVLDRTQLILDVFAQRAQSREGKIQVELAQLKYSLPRLGEKDDMLSRLTGGIGGRGPGETKIEIDRRRVREKISRLEKQIREISRRRYEMRRKRRRKQVPVISIVGYTNAGKSTLLNTLTKSNVTVMDQPFATLDPSSKRLRFPRDREVIITDTVGFIRDLPPDLLNAFKATLEELSEADLILHVVDISNPHHDVHINVVEKILTDLSLEKIPRILIYNKADLVDPFLVRAIASRTNGIAVCALDKNTLTPLLERIENILWEENKPTRILPSEETVSEHTENDG